MAEKQPGYWKGFVVGLLLLPGVSVAVTLVATVAMVIVGKKAIDDGS